jgi:hypothetical protein
MVEWRLNALASQHPAIPLKFLLLDDECDVIVWCDTSSPNSRMLQRSMLTVPSSRGVCMEAHLDEGDMSVLERNYKL